MNLALLTSKSGLVKNGLVAEYKMQKANLLKWSEDFSNAVWNTSAGAVVTPNQDIAPDGSLTADLVNFSSGTTYVQNISATSCPPNTYTASVWVKTLSGIVNFRLDITQFGTDHFSPIFTATTNWQRFSFTATLTLNVAGVLILPSSNASLLVWGAQLSLGSTPLDYEKTTDNQTLLDTSGKGNNGQLGSTTGVDTNDPTFDGQGLRFTTDDYVKLPYMINAEQDFTIYLVANVGASLPSSNETYLSIGNSSINNQYLDITRDISGSLYLECVNNASNYKSTLISNASLVAGKRLFLIKRRDSIFYLKDVVSGKIATVGAPSSPMTFNQVALGVLLRTATIYFINQPQYMAHFFARATTDAEDQQMLRYIKKELAKSGVSLSA